MLRGLLAGGFWGAFIGGIALALTSQLADWRDLTPALTEAETEKPPLPSGADTSDGAQDAPVVVSGADIDRPEATGIPAQATDRTPTIAAPTLEVTPPSAPTPTNLPAVVEAPAAPAPDTGSVSVAEVGAAPALADIQGGTTPPAADAAPAQTETATALTPARLAPDAQEDIGGQGTPAAAIDQPDAPADLSDERPDDRTITLAAALSTATADASPDVPTAPAAPAPETVTETLAPATADTATPAPAGSDDTAPAVAAAPAAGDAPEAGDTPPAALAAPETPTPEVAEVAAPAAPEVTEAAPSVAEDAAPRVAEAPSAGAAPEVGDQAPAALTAPEAPASAVAEVATPTAPAAEAPASDSPVVVAAADPALPTAPETPESPATTDSDAPVARPADPAPTAEEAPQVAETAQPETPAPATPEPAKPEPLEIAQADPPASAIRPRINRIGSGSSSMPGVRVNRLPRIGGDEQETAAPAPQTADATDPNAPAIVRNAIPFDPPADTALMSVVLLHEPGAAISATPVPMTFGVAAVFSDAATVASSYREAGHEIALIPDLPPMPSAQDVEVALGINLDAIPGAVALLDPDGGGFQANRNATAQAVAVAAETGHGIVSKGQGFSSATRAAAGQGVPAASVFREIDPTLSDRASISRALDQAALRARTEGRLVVIARANEAQIAGVLAWALENRGGSVALAPLSAVLQAE